MKRAVIGIIVTVPLVASPEKSLAILGIARLIKHGIGDTANQVG